MSVSINSLAGEESSIEAMSGEWLHRKISEGIRQMLDAPAMAEGSDLRVRVDTQGQDQ
jgi:hypothetical protein